MNALTSNLQPTGVNLLNDFHHVELLEEPLCNGQSGVPVLQLLTALRQFHRARDLSHQERFGTPDINSRQALEELNAVQRSLEKAAKGSADDNSGIVVGASLTLSLSAQGA